MICRNHVIKVSTDLLEPVSKTERHLQWTWEKKKGMTNKSLMCARCRLYPIHSKRDRKWKVNALEHRYSVKISQEYSLSVCKKNHFWCIFAIARGARMRSPFLVSKAPNSPPNPKKGLLGPGWLCKRATLGMAFGPNELPSVALSHCHSGRTRTRPYFYRWFRMTFQGFKSGVRVFHVRLFQNV